MTEEQRTTVVRVINTLNMISVSGGQNCLAMGNCINSLAGLLEEEEKQDGGETVQP